MAVSVARYKVLSTVVSSHLPPHHCQLRTSDPLSVSINTMARAVLMPAFVSVRSTSMPKTSIPQPRLKFVKDKPHLTQFQALRIREAMASFESRINRNRSCKTLPNSAGAPTDIPKYAVPCYTHGLIRSTLVFATGMEATCTRVSVLTYCCTSSAAGNC